jgi:hypothetical protein
VTPLPTGTAQPAPTATPAPAPEARSGVRRFVDRVFGWPIPLAVEVLVVIAGAYILLRWRQRRLDIEGPP